MSSWDTLYPRPQMRRDSFFPLTEGWTLSGQPITAPFPPQSPASGYTGKIGEVLRYETSFTLPAAFFRVGMRVLLHFGAVDQIADVSVNGKYVAHHEGGYLPFTADVTDALLTGENQLVLRAEDRLSHDYPYGKQSLKPGGMWYTPVSGIWQTVWLEVVPEKYIRSVKIVPDLTGIDLTVDSGAAHCDAVVTLEGEEIARASWTLTGKPRRIEIPEEHRRLWSPDSPVLYEVSIKAGRDKVLSYFALRTVEILPDARGHRRICLNGEPVFLNGVLDQGYFPDGVFLPGDPDEYERDVLRMKKLGFNMLRKHVKVEPEVFYHACDRLGMLVMQDLVNNGSYNFVLDTALPTIGVKYTPHLPVPQRRKAIFEQCAKDTLQHLHNHPCIIAYTIFNEGWGQFDGERMYHLLQDMDPSRFYDVASGWYEPKETDVDSVHVYFRNKRLHPGKRPMLLSECGGYGRPIEGHLHNPEADYGYGKTDTAEQLTRAIDLMYTEMVNPAIPVGLCGVVYTQLSDVEDEINGLYTYDREVCKVDREWLRGVMAKAQRTFEDAIAPKAQEGN